VPVLAHHAEHQEASVDDKLGLLVDELGRKRLTPVAGERPGYQPPVTG
jgi:hypothetical protein